MKKVKIMLMATLVVAAVGGALAFKASKFGASLFCGTTNTTCIDFQGPSYTTALGEPLANWYCSTRPTTDCPIRVTFNN